MPRKMLVTVCNEVQRKQLEEVQVFASEGPNQVGEGDRE
jgi:hypothetical protein